MTRRTIRTAAACSALALATALAAGPAAAQSFQGSSNVTFGSATVTQGTGTTDIDVASPSAVIDWTPTDNATANNVPITFQPTGTTATITGVNGDFALLNRIVPTDATRPILFDGNVISQLQTGAGLVRGGTVFFYSPGGIIVGANAVFDVGNLGLTTAAPIVDGNGNWYVNNTVQFSQAISGSTVRIDPGAQISALAEGSYFAAFAPHVVQNGTIDVNGQAALVAGEAGTITFSPDGLFDIQVTIGTDETFAIDHNGATGGPASGGAGDNHRVYMVAVPKNQAIQLAIGRGSEIGFDIAGAADVVGNAVVLSAGYGVTGGQVNALPSGGSGEALISINDSNQFASGSGIDFTSAVTGTSSGRIFVDVFRQTNFASDVLLQSVNFTQVTVGSLANEPTGQLNVAGNLTLGTRRFGNIGSFAQDAGVAQLFLFDGSAATIGGNLTINASPTFDFNGDGILQGGTAGVQISDGSSLDVAGSALISSTADSAFATSSSDARGGFAYAQLFGGSTMNVGGVLRLRAEGLAGRTASSTAGQGFDGQGGTSSLLVSEGSTVVTNQLNVSADGVGGTDIGSGGGAGAGGSATVTATGAGSALTVQSINTTGVASNGDFDLVSAEGFGGPSTVAGGQGGTGSGGGVSIQATAGGAIALPTDAVNPNAQLQRIIARGTGGTATGGGGSRGGDAFAGSISIFLDNGTLVGDQLLPSGFAQGGSGDDGGNAFGGSRSITLVNGSTFTGSVIGGSVSGVGGNGSAAGSGGDGTGGQASLTIDNSTLNVTSRFLVFTQAGGGSGGVSGGDASGGDAFAQVINGGVINIAPGGDLFIGANSFANNDLFFNGIVPQAGGNATAGNATLRVNGGTITGQGTVLVDASGNAAAGAIQGGTGTGGNAFLDIVGGTVDVTTVNVRAAGQGGGFFAADAPSPLSPIAGIVASNGTGGNAQVNLTDATLNAGTVEVAAFGRAGTLEAAGFTGMTGGTGTAGRAAIGAVAGSSTVTAGNIRVDATGTGSALLAGAGNAGNGRGGDASASASNGAGLVFNGALSVIANGEGGSVQDGGAGGSATSGFASVFATTGGAITIQNGNLIIDGSATGGSGTTGGAATFDPSRDQAVIDANGGTITVNGQSFLTANATGGNGGTGAGGAGTSGDVVVNARNGGVINFSADANADSFAFGGSSQDSDGGSATSGLTLYIAQAGGTINQNNPNAAVSADSSAVGGASNGLGDGGDAFHGRAHVIANGGTISIAGNLGIQALADGGSGVNGGDALALANGQTEALLTAQNGTITVGGQTGLVSESIGGNGAIGGRGGNAISGDAVLDVFTQLTGAPARIELGDLAVGVFATGGDGGAGVSEGAGGAGGDATSTALQVFATAGNGTLVVNGSTNLLGIATGGLGGAGGGGINGGAGGAGGAANSGYIQFGTRSGADTPNNQGSATFGDVQAESNAFGGTGGAGGVGSASTGNGGAGGNAISAGGVLLVRGSQVTANNVILNGVGIGGDGGTGAVAGAGGFGVGGAVSLTASQRFERTDRGSATIGSMDLLSLGQGGTGSTPGASYYGDSGGLFVQQSDVTFGTFDYANIGTDVPSYQFQAFVLNETTGQQELQTFTNAVFPIELSLSDATVVAGAISMTTPGDFTLNLDDSNLDVGDLFLSANTFVLPATVPLNPGTINVANNLNVLVGPGGSFLTYANFNTAFGVGFTLDGDFRTGDFAAAGDIFVESLTGSITMGDLSADGEINMNAAQAISVGNASAGGAIDLEAGTTATALDLVSSQGIDVSGVDSVSVGTIDAGTDPEGEITVGLASLNGTVTAGDISALGQVGVLAGAGATLGSISGTDVILLMGGNLVTGAIDASGRVHIADDGDIAIGGGLDADPIDVEAILASSPNPTGGSVTINGALSATSFTAGVGGSLAIAGPIAVDQISVRTDGDLAAGDVTSSGDIAFVGVSGSLTLGAVQAGGRFDTFVSGTQTIGDVTAGSTVDIRGTGGITTGAIAGPASIYVISEGGSVATGNIAAGDSALDGRRFGIGLRGQSVSTGNLSATSPIIASAQAGALAVGNVSSGGSILLFSAGSTATGGLTAGPASGGTVYIGGTDNLARLGAGDDFSQVIAVDPTRTAGSVSIAGPVSGDSVLVAAGGALSAAAISAASRVSLDAGGLASLSGRVAAPSVRVSSTDIAIGSGGSIEAVDGTATLISLNTNQAVIGDVSNATSGVYQLDNSEFGRISGGSVEIYALDNPSQPIDMLIGNLTITGPNAGSTIESAEGYIEFATGVAEDAAASGAIRIVGAVNATGFTPDNEIEINTGIFEIDAATGSLRVLSSPGSLGGIIDIEADHIHIASAAILERLRQNPSYEGRDRDLNQPGAIDRPEGVISALGLEFYPGRTLYIQNTGTAASPAGFLTTVENSDIEPPGFEDPTAPPVDVIINGRFVGPDGEITGKAAFDAVIANAESSQGFTATSQINSCSVSTSACTNAASSTPPTNTAEIEVLTEDQTEEEPFDTEEEEEDAEQAASAPIAPPVVLINTSPLNPDVDITDPVSGTGNPALIGSSITENPQGDQQ